MNKWKVLAVILTLLSLGALKETFRILTSSAPDIAQNRQDLIPMAVIITSVVIFFTIKFWRKANDKRQF